MAADILAALVATQLAGCIGIVLVLALRVPARRAFGVVISYRLWIVPVLMATFTFIPVPGQVAGRLLPPIVAEPAASLAPLRSALPDASPGLASMILLIWLAGTLFSAAALLHRQWRFQRGLGVLRALETGPAAFGPRMFLASTCDGGPALIGIVAPRIVLPVDFNSRFSRDEQDLVIAHETVHLRSGDSLVNAFVALLQSLCWFNPLVHFAVARLRIDQELACDAAVLERFPDARRLYAEAMIKTQVAPDGQLLGCFWSPGSRRALKERIMNLKLPPVPAGRRRLGMLVIASLGMISSYSAWAVAPGASDGGFEAAVRAHHPNAADGRRAVLRLTVGSGISVRSSDGHYSCTDNARCEFDLSRGGHFLLRAAGRSGADYRWTGCTSADQADGCIVELTGALASVAVR